MAVTHFLKTSVSKDDKGLYSLEGKGIFRIAGKILNVCLTRMCIVTV